MASFLRRISHAVLPQAPNAAGATPAHVPRRATETFSKKDFEESSSDAESSGTGSGSRASWELSDSESRSSSGSSGSDTDSSGSRSDDATSSDSDSDYEDHRRQVDKYDMMTKHLWSSADRHGWFRDAEYDGLVSIR